MSRRLTGKDIKWLCIQLMDSCQSMGVERKDYCLEMSQDAFDEYEEFLMSRQTQGGSSHPGMDLEWSKNPKLFGVPIKITGFDGIHVGVGIR